MPEAARYFLRLRSAISSHLSHAIVPQHTKPQVIVHFASAMDIDDILASVDRSDVSSPESTALDHQLLTRFWVAERTAPELLPWPARLMDRMMERVRQQIETIEDLAAASSDPVASASNATATATLTLSILQTDLSRTQYLLRSLLRQRLSKLTKHSMYYLLLSSSSPAPIPPPASGSTEAKLQQPEDSVPVPDPESLPSKSPLSPSEANFIYTHQTLLARHFGSSFLSSFPPQLRRLDDNAGGTSMVQGPDAREALFVRCLAEEVLIVAPPGDGVDEEVSAATMRMGDVWVVRWEGIKKAWERGDVEVL